jgi:iron(III) transport system permease protein
MPLVTPAAIASWLLVVIVCFREFTVGMILYRPANVVVGVHLWNLYARGRVAEASALGFVMILIVSCAAFLGRRLLMPEVSRA